MSAPPFMQLYVADYLGDTRHLTTEQHGAYLLLLMAMWRAGGHLSIDPKKLARIVGLSGARWRRIEGDVLEFFIVQDGQLQHIRVQKELAKANEISTKRAASGKRGGDSKSLKNNNAGVANATDLPQHTRAGFRHQTSEPEEETSEAKASSVGDTATERPPDRRCGTRLPEDWTPSDIDLAIARKEGLTDDDIQRATSEFRNFWCARAGREATKLKWPMVWANRVQELGQRKRERENRGVVAKPILAAGRNGGDVSFADLFVQRFGNGADGG